MKMRKTKSKKGLGMKQKQKQKQTVKQSVNLKLMAGAPSAPGGFSGYAAPIILPTGYGPESIDAKIALWEAKRAAINVNDRDPERKNNAEDAYNKVSINPVHSLDDIDQNRYNAINGNFRYNQARMFNQMFNQRQMMEEMKSKMKQDPQVKQEPVDQKAQQSRKSSRSKMFNG